MKSQFDLIIRVRFYKIVMVVLGIATVVCFIWYLKSDNAKIEPLLAGLVTGLLVAFIQYMLDLNEHQEIENIKKLGIRRILPSRDDKAHYMQLIDRSKKEIYVLGNTASRLLNDFAHPTRSDSCALLEALGRNVGVRILLPKLNYLSQEDRAKAETARKRMAEIGKQYPKFEYRFFNHLSTHSIMKIDDECLVGPIFPNVKTMDSPALHVNSNSAFVVEYLRHFEAEWTMASSSE